MRAAVANSPAASAVRTRQLLTRSPSTGTSVTRSALKPNCAALSAHHAALASPPRPKRKSCPTNTTRAPAPARRSQELHELQPRQRTQAIAEAEYAQAVQSAARQQAPALAKVG